MKYVRYSFPPPSPVLFGHERADQKELNEYAPPHELPSYIMVSAQKRRTASSRLCHGLVHIFSAHSKGFPELQPLQRAQLMRSCVRNKRKLAAVRLGYFVPAAFHLEAQKNTIWRRRVACAPFKVSSQANDVSARMGFPNAHTSSLRICFFGSDARASVHSA